MQKKKIRNPDTGPLACGSRTSVAWQPTCLLKAAGPCPSLLAAPASTRTVPCSLVPGGLLVTGPCSPVQGTLCTGRCPSPPLSLGLMAVEKEAGQDGGVPCAGQALRGQEQASSPVGVWARVPAPILSLPGRRLLTTLIPLGEGQGHHKCSSYSSHTARSQAGAHTSDPWTCGTPGAANQTELLNSPGGPRMLGGHAPVPGFVKAVRQCLGGASSRRERVTLENRWDLVKCAERTDFL